MNVFETFKPKNEIVSKFVQYYYLEINTNNKIREFSCFPHFNNSISLYKSHKRIENGIVEYVANEKPVQIFTPIRDEIFTVKQIGEIHRIVIVFNPLGIENFYSNLHFSNFIWNHNFFEDNELHSLFQNQNIEELSNLLDTFLLKRYSKNENLIMRKSVENIFRDFQTFSVEKLSDELSVSRRHLNRLFNKHLGISIKKFQEIVLFRNTLEQKIYENPQQNFTTISYEMNFSDQSHLNKVFAKFTKNSPRKFIKKGTKIGKEDIFWHLT